jgi:hypothetical protein
MTLRDRSPFIAGNVDATPAVNQEIHLPAMISRNLCKDLGQLGGGLLD